MSWLENQVLLLVFSISWVLVGSDIYKSVMWTTNNPLFSDSPGLSRCFGKDLEMRVHLQSSLPIVCPFDFIIMKTLPSKPATGVLYENFWIAYDRESFEKCNINMTAVSRYGDKNKKLLECNSPEALKSFTYSIDFKAKTPANSGISFVGGEYYYFLATSDGTDGSLNNTAGGHCNDPKVHMKFKVYICKTDVEDKKCQNVSIGEFLCPSDLPEAATTTSPPTTVTSQPSIQITTDSSGGITNSSTVASTSGQDTSTVTTLYIATEVQNNSIGDKSARISGSQDILDELAWWKNAAIASFCCLVFLIVVILVVCCIKRRKAKPACFILTDLNKVTPPPGCEPNKELNMKASHNNLSYCDDDSEDGKPQYALKSMKPNGLITPAMDKPDKQSQVDPLPPLKDKTDNQSQVYPPPPLKDKPDNQSQVYPPPPLKDKTDNQSQVYPPPPLKDKPDKQSQVDPLPPLKDKLDKQSQVDPLPPLKDKLHGLKNNDVSTRPEKQGLEEHNQMNDPGKLHHTEKIGNGTPGEKKRKQHKDKKHKDHNRHSGASDVVSLPPEQDKAVLKKISPSPDIHKRALEMNESFMYDDHVV